MLLTSESRSRRKHFTPPTPPSKNEFFGVKGERGKKVQEFLFDELWRETKRQMRSIEVNDGRRTVRQVRGGGGLE